MKSCDKDKYNVTIDEKKTVVMGRYGPVIKNTELVNGKNKVSFTSVTDKKEDETRECETSEWGENPPVIKKVDLGCM